MKQMLSMLCSSRQRRRVNRPQRPLSHVRPASRSKLLVVRVDGHDLTSQRSMAGPCVIIGFLAAMLLGCSADGGMSASTTSCESDVSSFYVAATGAGGDGSSSCRAGTLEAALKSGKETIVLAGEIELAQTVDLPTDVTLRALSSSPARITCPASGDCIKLSGAATLRDLVLFKGGGHGVIAATGVVRLENLRIEAMSGDGVHIAGPAEVVVQSCAIIANKGRGIFAKGISSLAVIDPVYAPAPLDVTDQVGVIDPVYQPASVISDNGEGGIAVIDPVYSPKSDRVNGAVVVNSTLVDGNRRYGIGLWGGALELKKSAVVATKAGAKGAWADGVLVAKGGAQTAPSSVIIHSDSLISANARTGLLVAHDAVLTVHGRIGANGLGGIWAHGKQTKVTLTASAVIVKNKAVGVVATAGATLEAEGAVISQSLTHEVAKGIAMGDGVGIYNGGRATLRNIELIDNERAAIVVHGAKKNAKGEADVVVEGCKMAGSAHTFVINGAPVPDSAAAAKNNASSGAGSGSSGSSGGSSGGERSGDGYSGNASLPVQTGYCDGKDPDSNADCVAPP